MSVPAKQQGKPNAARRAAAILRRANMPDADIAVALGVTERTLRNWRADAEKTADAVRRQFAEFAAGE